jgi:spermidine synthase
MAIDEYIPNVTIPEGQSGIWRVERFTISEEAAQFQSLRMAFKGGGRTARAGIYTRLMRGGTLVMSDTWDEKRDHYWFVRQARGRVLVNGLGIGMVLNALLLKQDIEHVTVVEKSPDVIALVAAHYACPRFTVVEADALEYRPPVGERFGAVWHDIWDDICADNLPEMHRLHRRYGRRADWQGSWARELCERYA